MIHSSIHPHALLVTQFYFILFYVYTVHLCLSNFSSETFTGIHEMNQFPFYTKRSIFSTLKFCYKVNSFHPPEVRYDFYIK